MTDATENKKPNRRAVKAAAAGALGVALLAGLGTTFAKWYEEQEIGSSELKSGHLNIKVENAKWVDVNHGNKTIEPASFKMVPGDKLKYTADVTPDLVGDNLEATLQVNTSETVSGDLKGIVNVTTKVGDGDGDQTKRIVTPNDTTAIPVTVELEFPLTTDGQTPKDDKSNWQKDRGEDSTVNLASTKVELLQNNNPKTAGN